VATLGPSRATDRAENVTFPQQGPLASEFPDHDEALEGSLGRLLCAHIEIQDTLPLVSCLIELALSLRHARSNTWRVAQRRSLSGDIDMAFEVPGTVLRGELGPLLNDVHELGRQFLQLQRIDNFSGQASPSRLLKDVERLRERLAEPASVQACWGDVVDGVRNGIPLRVIEDRVRLLFSMLEAAHHNVEETRRHLHRIIADGGIPWSKRNDGQAIPSTLWRLAKCESFLGRVAPSGHCIGWVALDGGRLPQVIVESGSVTFFEAQWVVPNARRDNGQTFPHREELREIAIENAFGGVPEEPDIVLARADLGHRPVAGALGEAWQRAMFVAGYATLSAQSDPWPKRGWYCLSVDGVLTHGWFAPDDEFRERNSFQMERIGFEFSRIADTLNDSGGWSSPDLTEAVDCAIEARGADVRNRNLLRWRVLEMVAAFADLGDVNELLELLKGQWARNALGSRPVHAVIWTILSHLPGSPDGELARSLNLALLKCQPQGRIRVLVREALTMRTDLLKISKTAPDRRSLDEHLDVLSDPSKALERLADHDREEELLFSRMRRVRNALTHGNPMAVEAISSIDSYVLYMTEFALQEAITSQAGKPILYRLADIRSERTRMRLRLQAGDDPIDALGLDRSV